MSSGSRLRLVPCTAEPRHWKVYGYWNPERDYEPPCMYCAWQDLYESHSRCEHARHGAWRRWKLTHRIVGFLYASGIASSGGCTSWGGGCKMCLSSLPSFSLRKHRPYILWIRTSSWNCLLRRRHIPTADKIAWGMCSKCLPCGDCGSTEPFHDCQVAAQVGSR